MSADLNLPEVPIIKSLSVLLPLYAGRVASVNELETTHFTNMRATEHGGQQVAQGEHSALHDHRVLANRRDHSQADLTGPPREVPAHSYS